MNIGTCGHPIDDEWYEGERSSYYVLDEPTGIVTYVTTCRDCWEKANEAGLICDGPVMDDFDPGEPEVPDYVIDGDGSKIRLTEDEPTEEDLGPLSSYFDN